MTDYGRMFGGKVASGLGLGQPSSPRISQEEYLADPSAAFSRMAEFFQGPDGELPLPFGIDSIPHAGKPRPA